MRRGLCGLALLLCLAVLQGCASKSSIPKLPDTLGGKGLLVARLYMPGSAAWNNAQITIDNSQHNSGLRDGFIAVALDPGEHDFARLRVEGLLSFDDSRDSHIRKVRGGGGAPTYYYVPGGTTRIYFTTLSVNRHFSIEAGKITNLGLMIYLSADDPAKQRAAAGNAKEYRVVLLDNSAEIGYYLETNYPALMATLDDHTPRLAQGNYFEAKRLPELRRFIAAQEGRKGKVIKNGNLSVLYGDAGTLVAFKPDPGGKLSAEVLDTGTLANIVDARRDGDRLVFLTAEAKLLTLEEGKLAQTRIPYRIHPVKMSSLGKNNLTIVDNRMSILSSQDGGANWTRYDGARIDTPRSDIGMVTDTQGAYVYLGMSGVPNPILYLPAGQTTPQFIASPPPLPPASGPSYNNVIARDSGLFIVYSRRDFYFRSNATRVWQLYSKPGQTCKGIGFDAAGVDLTIECDGTTFESSDSGYTWTKAGGA